MNLKTFHEKYKTPPFSSFLMIVGLFIIASPIHWSQLYKTNIIDQIKVIHIDDVLVSILLTGILLLVFFLLRKKANKSFIETISQNEINLKSKNDELEL